MKKRKVFLLFAVTAVLSVLLGFSVYGAKTDKIILKTANTAQGIKLTWNCEEETTYAVFKKSGDGEYEKAARIKGGVYMDKSVLSGTEYTYYIKKTYFVKSAEKSLSFIATPELTYAANKSEGIKLVWKKVEGAESYTVVRKEQGGKWEKILVGTKKNSFTDTKVNEGKKYSYFVRAQKGNTVSGNGNTLSVYRLVSPEVAKISNGAQGVKLTWNKISGAKEYAVYRKVSGGEWENIASVKDGNTLNYTDKTASSGIKYTYGIKAVRGEDKSQGTSGKKSIVYLDRVKGLKLSQRGKNVELSWKAVKGAESYAVYKKTEGGEWKKTATVKKVTDYSCTLGSIAETAYFKVKAIKGKTAASSSVSVKTRKTDPNKPMVALTYDDGPHGTHTLKILNVLEKYDARATFFIVGSRIESYPYCLERAADIGCEIGNHTYGHISLSTSSKSEIESEINKTNNLVKKYTGNTVTLARAPGGVAGKALSIVDMPFIYWSIDTRDWESRNASSIVSIVKKQVCDGSIILMHDIYSSTAEASEILIPWLVSQGYQLVTVTEMMEAKGIELKSGKVYYNAYS